jgi:hypothetical protein
MRGLIVGLVFGGVAACGVFAGIEEDPPSPPVVPAVDGSAPGVDAAKVDAVAPVEDTGAPDAYVRPPCFVTVAPGEPVTTLEVTPAAPRANQYVGFAAKNTTPLTSVKLRVCLASGEALDNHYDGPITGSYVWNYSHDGGLPEGSTQAQFWAALNGSSPVVPRATAEFIVAP